MQSVGQFQMQINRQQSSENSKQLKNNEALYTRLNSRLMSLRKRYRDLAIQKELTGKLSAKEEVRLARLSSGIQRLDKAYKKVDGTMGIHNRNV